MRYKQIRTSIFENQELDEVRMGPSNLKQWLNSPEADGMLMGVEFEMGVPGAYVQDDDYDLERNDDADERANSIDEVIDFFQSGEFSGLSTEGARRLRSEMYDQFMDWVYEKSDEEVKDSLEFTNRMRDAIEDQMDESDYFDEAEQELTAGSDSESKEPSEEDIAEKARELMDQAIDEMMISQDSSEWERAYDRVYEEMIDEYRDNYDESDWLEDIGIRWMSDAEREYNLDWPHYYTPDSQGSVAVDEVANDFAVAMKLDNIEASNDYHGARRDGKTWIVEPDGSIDADSGDGGLEFVSPPMPLKDGVAMIKKVYDWAKDYGCYTNKSTGLHMNISVPDLTIEKLDYVKLALFLGDQHILEKFGRQYNTYTKSAMSLVKDRVSRKEVAVELLSKMKSDLNLAASKAVHDGITHKYTSINTKSNYVEFRGPGGDYLSKEPEELINTAIRLAMSLRIATDPNAYKQEYAKKLYKLIAPSGEWSDPRNLVALFSRYSLGEIQKGELIDNIRQAQQARKEKNEPDGPEQMYWVMNKDGTGGKQLVIARSLTKAIIAGGSNMGMDKAESLNTLTAELHKEIDQTETDPRRYSSYADAQAAADQQAELVNRDDPVTSNDPESQTADYEVYNSETGQVISVAPGATLDYAVSRARSQEQDLGLSAGTLQVRRRGETNESINTIRRLAGVI